MVRRIFLLLFFWSLEFTHSPAVLAQVDYSCYPCNNGGRCVYSYMNPFYDLVTYFNQYFCYPCQCPSGYSGPCCNTYVDPCSVLGTCDSNHVCHSYANLTYSCDCPTGKTGPDCQDDVDFCEDNICRIGSNCTLNPLTYPGYTCECPDIPLIVDYSGTYCEKASTQVLSPCVTTDCKNGGVCFEDGGLIKHCVCPSLTSGTDCAELHPCHPSAVNPCSNEGRCVPGSGSSYTCDCLDIWTGPTCTFYNICNNKTNPCVHGTCEPTGSETYVCHCDPGYYQTDCDEEINECIPNPCQYESTCIDGLASYSCNCVVGTTGENCSINFDDCGTQPDVWHSGECFTPTYCNTVDEDAECLDLVNGYSCQCSSDYTDVNCTMKLVVWKAIQAMGGDSGMDLEELIALLNDMVEKPSLIKDMLPFMVALMPLEDQMKMGYNFDETFEWVSYERTELQKEEIEEWYETTLGNCFTFNTPGYTNYTTRRAGLHGGFKAMLHVGSAQYLSWIDTQGLNVFIHDPTVTIFGESVRYTITQGQVASLHVSRTSYRRLGGNYGNCAKDSNDVGSYYYDGAYTTDGCLRSCYQDKVFSACGCVDPRYPRPENKTTCPLSMRDCVMNVTDVLGDPSNWPDCYCPLPCMETQYQVDYSAAGFSYADCESLASTAQRDVCKASAEDTVILEVFFPKIFQQVFVETPKTGLSTFIGYTGGLLGSLTGISIITLIEFVYLIYRICHANAVSYGRHISKNPNEL